MIEQYIAMYAPTVLMAISTIQWYSLKNLYII